MKFNKLYSNQWYEIPGQVFEAPSPNCNKRKPLMDQESSTIFTNPAVYKHSSVVL